MISYMCDKKGYLVINRDIVGANVADFEYTPHPKYPGPFQIFNEPNEAALIRRFLSHIQVFVIYL